MTSKDVMKRKLDESQLEFFFAITGDEEWQRKVLEGRERWEKEKRKGRREDGERGSRLTFS